jgi:ABC-type sugar transport system permease subunit
MGYGAALAFVLFSIILTLTILQNQILEKRVHYS